ncbi:MAG: Glutathione transport system permease protein GsiC [Planctomycetota bacterium]|jgi:peptide/nickel transport system permease protein
MATFLLRRLLLGILTLLVITCFVYGLARAMPGTPLTAQMGEDPSRKLNPEDQERLRRIYGLDKPWYTGYAQWLGNVARGDLGRSITRKQPVTTLIAERIGPTFLISGTALLLIWLMAIPLGLYASARSGTADERATSLLLYVLYSFPTFVAALFLQIVFSVWLRGTPWELPLFGMTDLPPTAPWLARAADVAHHAILPVVCQTYVSLAYDSRFIRANMAEVLRQDYIRTARAKGAGPWRVLFRHAFRNTLIPLATLIGLSLPGLIGGSVIIEQIFTWPGMGRLFFESIRERDYPTIMGLTLMFSVLTLLGQLLADLLYCLVDPRVSVE